MRARDFSKVSSLQSYHWTKIKAQKQQPLESEINLPIFEGLSTHHSLSLLFGARFGVCVNEMVCFGRHVQWFNAR